MPMNFLAGGVGILVGLGLYLRVRSSWSFLEKTFDHSGIGLLWLNLGTGKVIRANRAFADLLRTTPERLSRICLAKVQIPEKLVEPLQEVRAGRCVSGIEFKVKVDSQPELVVGIDAVPIRAWFRWSQVLVIVRDQTEATIVSNRLLQGQKLEALGTLAGGVAHDFNNLLQVIIGYADLLDDSAEVAKIRSASSRATTLIRQLLIFSRRQSIEPRRVDCSAMIRDLIVLLRPLLGPIIEIVVIIDENLPPIWVDRNQIEMAITNLAINSMHAMSGKPGKLTISAVNVDLPRDEPDLMLESGRYVKFRVEDNGSGIPKELLTRIFEPFFTTKVVGKGTGLGLSTVYGVVHRNKGEIRVSSTEGVGTAFEIFLPTQIDYEGGLMEDGGQEVALTGAFGNERILVIEDEPMIRSLVFQILTQNGYQTSVCQNGAEALRLSHETISELDIVITDMIMPHMNGLVVAQELTKVNPKLKKLFISGYTAEMTQFDKNSTEEAFLAKPFSAEDLLSAIRSFYPAS